LAGPAFHAFTKSTLYWRHISSFIVVSWLYPTEHDCHLSQWAHHEQIGVWSWTIVHKTWSFHCTLKCSMVLPGTSTDLNRLLDSLAWQPKVLAPSWGDWNILHGFARPTVK
jgi:hypothetical protein